MLTVPLLPPLPPLVMVNHHTSSLARYEIAPPPILAIEKDVVPLSKPTNRLEGVTDSNGFPGAWTTFTVLGLPSAPEADTVIVPVRADVLELVA